MKRSSSFASGFRGRRFVGMVLASVLLTSIAVGTACSNQGEGERCESLNGNDDCASGLICWEAIKIFQTVDRCCPSDLTKATAAECKAGGQNVLDADVPDVVTSQPEPDSSTATPDSSSDADTDTDGSDGSVSDASDQ